MAISTAAAIIGSAVIGAGASAISSAKASKTAANAATAAADANAQVSRDIYNQTRTDLAPYNQAGQMGLAALLQRLGLTPTNGNAQPSAAPAPAATDPAKTAARATEPGRTSVVSRQGFGGGGGVDYLGPGVGGGATPAAGGVNYAQLFQDRPDVLAEYRKVAAQADPNSPFYTQHGLDRGQEGFADWWLANKPAEDTYTAPTLAATPTGQPAADPNAPPPTYASETYAPRPEAAPIHEYTRSPDAVAPNIGDFFTSDFTKDPSYQYRLDESLRGVNAAWAGRGMTRGGDTGVALLKKAGQEASQEYGNQFQRALQLFDRANDNYRYGQDRTDRNFLDDRSYGTNLAITNRGRDDSIYSEDRGFQAGRYDQGTSNLFGLVGLGQNAASGGAAAGNNYANQVIAANNNRATTTANAAIANGANVSNLFGSAANAIGTYYGSRQPTTSLPRSYSI